MIKTLITGALGHIGSYLIRELDPTRFDITVVDNLSTERYCSLFDLPREIKFRPIGFEQLTIKEISEFDAVLHLAAKTNAVASFDDDGETERVNLTLTREFIDKCEQSKCKRFIFPSSTSVYGKGNEIKKEDDRNALLPQSPYAETKLNVETYLETSKLNYTILRCGTIFGVSSGMRFHTAINKFCWCAVMNEEIPVWRDNVLYYRPYLSLHDLRHVLYNALTTDKLDRDTFNVVSENRRMMDILNIVQKHFNEPLKMKFIDTPLLNQHSYFVSTEKLESKSIFTSHKVEDGIRDTIELLKGIKNG